VINERTKQNKRAHSKSKTSRGKGMHGPIITKNKNMTDMTQLAQNKESNTQHHSRRG
jgi:hypothetical protein